jgi:DNA-binding HxlR family transcriptional regulator
MKWAEYDSRVCSIARTVEIVGDHWTVLVLRDVFNGVRRFDDLRNHLSIARDVLAKRLSTLVDHGVLERVPYQTPRSRTRYEYQLTQAGRDLRPVLLALIEWGDRHRAEPVGPPTLMLHDECGAPVRVVLECARGHRVEPPTRTRLEPGPGARPLQPVAPGAGRATS